MLEPTFVQTAAGAVQIQQHVGLKNGCLVLRVTDILSPTPVTSTILLQTCVAWCTAVWTVGRAFTHNINILAMKRTARYTRGINPPFYKCYIQLVSTKKHSDGQMYIFYDFECLLNDDKKHITNLYVAHKVCNKCMELPITDPGCTCDRQ